MFESLWLHLFCELVLGRLAWMPSSMYSMCQGAETHMAVKKVSISLDSDVFVSVQSGVE